MTQRTVIKSICPKISQCQFYLVTSINPGLVQWYWVVEKFRDPSRDMENSGERNKCVKIPRGACKRTVVRNDVLRELENQTLGSEMTLQNTAPHNSKKNQESCIGSAIVYTRKKSAE